MSDGQHLLFRAFAEHVTHYNLGVPVTRLHRLRYVVLFKPILNWAKWCKIFQEEKKCRLEIII